MRITSKGQVTIPQNIREQAGLLPHTEVDFVYDGEQVTIIPIVAKQENSRGMEALRLLRGTAKVGLSTDDIMAHTRST